MTREAAAQSEIREAAAQSEIREAAAQSEIREAAAYIGITLFRNNSGVLPNPMGREVRFGLGNDGPIINARIKSSDLIGWHEPSGRFVSIEVKAPGWRGPRTDRELAQQRWIDAVRRAGGIAGFATCVGDLYAVVEQCA